MKKKVILFSLIFVFILAVIVFFMLFSYQISSKLITISSMRLESNNLKLTLSNNNDSGYLRKIKIVNKNKEIHIYFIGTALKIFRMDNKSTHNIDIDVNKIEKVIIKGRSTETIVFEMKDI
jgi:hypothetical protein